MNNEARGLVNKAVKQKNMDDVFLLTVRDHFQLSDIGLIVHPDFSVRDNKKWNDYYSEARIVYKEGNESVLEVHISTWHFNIRDPNVDIDKRWRVVLSFPD
ncbi:MAG: hypothetical protein JAZ17_20020 [Candidatus Thiodiazotropha endolucinida]|nr:hypothetical protein [Candidatus Thiodiazotropha endolucinida]